jgi:polyhydroxyalkanoate synthesis regulator phasin
MKALLIKENGTYFLKGDGIPNPAKLNLDNCDEIFSSLAVDVDKLADEECLDDIYAVKRRYKKGFNKAMELQKDKLFTLEDMFNLYAHIVKNGIISGEEANEYVQSLQQPTEIEVEIETETKVWEFISNGEFESFEIIPKLDENGCLILKKK